MLFQLTDQAISALQGNPTIRPTYYVLGSGTGYTPQPTDNQIHGTQVYSAQWSNGQVVNSNVLYYGITLGYNVGPFTFGEVGLFMSNGVLFALAVLDLPIVKSVGTSSGSGNEIQLDCYLSAVGTQYNAWLDVASTSNAFQMGVLNSVDSLPLANGSPSFPTAFIIRSRMADSFRAYNDGHGLWSFDLYRPSADFPVSSSTPLSITTPLSSYSGPTTSQTPGQYLIEFTSGAQYSICRTIQSILVSGTDVTLNFATPLRAQPQSGDSFRVFDREISHRTQLSIWIQGLLQPNDILWQTIPTVNMILKANLPLSSAVVGAGSGYVPVSSFQIQIQKNFQQVGTINFTAYQSTASFTFANDVWFNAGQDILSLVGPAVPDTAAANFTISIAGTY